MQTETITLFHGEALFRAGQPATNFYLVQRGTIIVVDQAGVKTCRQFGADELFGLPEVLAQSCWDLTAIASGLTEIRVFPAKTLFKSLSDLPERHEEFIRDLAKLA